jgi:hypothetical protein
MAHPGYLQRVLANAVLEEQNAAKAAAGRGAGADAANGTAPIFSAAVNPAAPPLAHVPPAERPPPVPWDLPIPSSFAGDLPGLRKQLRSLALLSQARRKGTKSKAFIGNRGHLQYAPKPSSVPEG